MKSTLFTFLFVLYSLSTFTSCSKYEKIDATPTQNPVTPMFIGVHTVNSETLIGFTNSDGSYTLSDTVPWSIVLSPNMDKHTSAVSVKNKRFYFLFKDASSGLLSIGIVSTDSGRFRGEHGLNMKQDDMVHLQYSESDKRVYFSMGVDIYEPDYINGGYAKLSLTDSEVKLPANYSAGSSYTAHTIDSKRFCYIKDDKALMIYDRSLKQWDSLTLPQSGSYRSLVVDSDDKNIMYAYVLTGSPDYKLVKIDLNTSTVTDVVKASTQYEFLWFQSRYCSDSKLYVGLPFDHQTFPYFITYNVDNGETRRYPTPSVLGQCILK